MNKRSTNVVQFPVREKSDFTYLISVLSDAHRHAKDNYDLSSARQSLNEIARNKWPLWVKLNIARIQGLAAQEDKHLVYAIESLIHDLQHSPGAA